MKKEKEPLTNREIPRQSRKMINSFKMLDLLKSNGRMKQKELSEQLGVTPRMINYYKTFLKVYGYNIITYGGWNGGLEYVPINKLSNDELITLKKIDGLLNGEYSVLIDKIIELNKSIRR